MNTWFAVSYALLWIVVLALSAVAATMFRQLGIMVMGTARGVGASGIPVGKKFPSLAGDIQSAERAESTSSPRPKLVFFGAPYCAECKELLPTVRSISSSGNVDVEFMIFGSPEESAKYAAENELHMPIVPLDDDTARKYDVAAVPFAFALDGEGFVKAKGLAGSIDALHQLVAQVAEPPVRLPVAMVS